MAYKSLPSKTVPVEEITFKVPWGVIQAKVWGPINGEPVLGLHGWMDNANTFDKLAPLLPANARFVSIDFPGHGKSSHRWPGMSYRIFEYVTDVKRVVTQLGWKRFSIIGHSMGGNVGSLYAGTFPDEIEFLVIIDYRAEFTKHSSNIPSKVLGTHIDKILRTDAATVHVYPTVEAVVEKRCVPMFGHTIQKEDASVLIARGSQTTNCGGVKFSHDPRLRYFRINHLLPLTTLLSILSNIKCAILILDSKDDNSSNPQHREELEKRLDVICTHGRFSIRKEVPGGHHTHLQYPERSAQEIKDFLTVSWSSMHNRHSKSKL